MVSPLVLITGSSSGIGYALCQEFHQRGIRVIATARRLEALAPLKTQGMRTLPLDVTDAEAIAQVITTINHEAGPIDILINNAGYGLFGPLMDISPAAIAQQFDTHVFAPLQLIQAVAPGMKAQGSGLIVNIGSISGIMTTPFAGAYCASKAALHGISDALRMELAPFGIQVVTVQPGAIASNFGKNALQSLSPSPAATSWYYPVRDEIQMRASLSQANATLAKDFAKQLVDQLLTDNIPPEIRLGKKSLQIPLLKKLLPTKILDNLLTKRFGLLKARLD